MLLTNNIHCYADDSTGDSCYTGRAYAPPEQVSECRMRLVSEIETSLEQVSEWGRRNLVQFNPSKTQVCAFSAKKAPFVTAPKFQGIPLTMAKSIGILGVDITNEVQFRSHLEHKAKLASKKLGCLTEPNSTSHLVTGFCYIKRRFDLIWSTVLISGLAPHNTSSFLLTPSNGGQTSLLGLELLSLRRDVGSLCMFYRLYNGECSEELFDLVPSSRFYHRTSRQRSKVHPHFLDTWHTKNKRASRSFLPRTCRMWNDLPPEVFPLRYDMGFFKKRVFRVLKGRQRLSGSCGVAYVHGRR
ncbi:uncharacterized protein LOC134665594 [Cydia fagiglandana]|uniref:uncharacterized protein LOC134665594 n=1 Tax=Cydia fagiglandana TaxID=1458189 RepID=UPI002FEE5807